MANEQDPEDPSQGDEATTPPPIPELPSLEADEFISPTPGASANRPGAPRTHAGAVATGIVLGLLGAAMFASTIVAPWVAELGRRDWQKTQCTMTKVRLLGPDSISDDCVLRVEYDYKVAGRRYEGWRKSFHNEHTHLDCKWATPFAETHPVGARVSCFYNPGEPQEATLDRGTDRVVGGWLWLILAVTGALMLLSGFSAPRRSRPKPPKLGFTAVLEPVRHQRETMRGTLALGAATVAATALLPITFRAAHDDERWMLFGVIGLVAAICHGFLWRRVLRHVGPKLVVTTDPPSLLGRETRIRIQLRGIMPVRHITARLLGREEAATKGGYTASRAQRVFFERTLASADRPGRSVSLEGTADLPVDSVPSFQGRGVAIRWIVAVQADIALWPDVEREYELRVDPEVVHGGSRGGAR